MLGNCVLVGSSHVHGSSHDGVVLSGGLSLQVVAFMSLKRFVLGCAFRVLANAWLVCYDNCCKGYLYDGLCIMIVEDGMCHFFEVIMVA